MKEKIYEQHNATFKNVEAFIILKDNKRVATIAFKFPRDGAGRLYAYVHWIGLKMVRGSATGYGYDKRSAAIESAFKKQPDIPNDAMVFWSALRNINGNTWNRALENAGFTVLQAV